MFYVFKFFQKKFINILDRQEFSLSLHPLSPLNRRGDEKVLKNIFEKSSLKIWRFQKYDLSLHSLFALNEKSVRR